MQKTIVIAIASLSAITNATCLAQTTTAAISGLVRDINTRSPVGNVKVILGAGKNRGGQLVADNTTNEGVYILSSDSIHASVDVLYVWSQAPYSSRPLESPLDAEFKGVRRSKPSPLEVLSNTTSPLARSELIYVIVCIQETEGVKTLLSLQSTEDAHAQVRMQTKRALARFPNTQDTEAVGGIVDAANRQLNKKLVPEPLITKQEVLSLQKDEDFQADVGRTKQIVADIQAMLRGNEGNRRETFDFVMNAHPTVVDPAWFGGKEVEGRIQRILIKINEENANYWFDVVPCETGRALTVKGLKITDRKLAPGDLAQWVGRNRAGGKFFLQHILLEDPALPELARTQLMGRLRQEKPVVVSLDPGK